MQIASGDSTWPVMASFRWTRQYFAMQATPLGVRDIFIGHQLYMASRIAATSAVYLAIIAAFGAVDSWFAVFTLPAVTLLGLAFTVPTAAYAATQNSEGAFVPYNRFVIVPMFLFSGTFFPVSRLPLPLDWLAYATPLWHGVDLCRELTLGNVHLLRALGHVVYLLLFVVVGFVWGQRTYKARLFN